MNGPKVLELDRINPKGLSLIENVDEVLPFLKWAGGKRWLTPYLLESAPKKFGTYHEPFLGGAANFFALQPSKAVLSDLNRNLVETYKAIRDDWRLVLRYLKQFARAHSKERYYLARNKHFRSRFKNAALFIYLNRVCWNGLYRVNLRGEFNVPLGTKTSVLLDSDDFSTLSDILQNIVIRSCDFESAIDMAKANDFVFLDPPYVTAHNFNGFVKYNERLFGWQDQIRLRDAIRRATSRNVHILMTNADHESVRDLYKGLGSITQVPRASVISGAASARKQTTEIVLRTY